MIIDGELLLAAKNDAGEGLTDLSWQRFCIAFTAKPESVPAVYSARGGKYPAWLKAGGCECWFR